MKYLKWQHGRAWHFDRCHFYYTRRNCSYWYGYEFRLTDYGWYANIWTGHPRKHTEWALSVYFHWNSKREVQSKYLIGWKQSVGLR